MADYSEDAASALELIAEAGFTLAMSHPVAGVYDPVTGAESGGSTLTGNFTVVTVPSSSSKSTLDDELKAELVKGNLRFFLVAGSGAPFRPEGGDLIPSFQSKKWKLVGCTALEPDGETAILYKIIAQRV